MKKIVRCLLKSMLVLLMLFTQTRYIDASNLVLNIQYPDGYSTGRLIYGWGSGNVCEDGKDHRLINVGGEDRFLGVFYLNGEVVYCIQPFVETKTGYKYTSTHFYESILNSSMRDYLELASYFGYGYNSDYSLLSCIATQHAIWEFQGAQVTNITPELRERIDVIKQRVYDYLNKKKPSFDSQTFTFQGYGKEYAITITDTNNVIKDWCLTSAPKELNYEITENTIKVWVDQPFFDTKTIEYNLYNPNDTRVNGNSIVFINPNNAQKLAHFADPVKRETKLFFTMAMGDFEIQKYMNSNSEGTGIQMAEEGAEFIAVKKEYVDKYGSVKKAYEHKTEFMDCEYDYLITNENGYAKSKKLCAGNYLVEQISGAKDTVLYDKVLQFNVNQWNQKTVSFELTNVKFSSYLKVVKVDENGNTIKNNQMKFKIKDSHGNFIERIVNGKIQNEWTTNVDGEIILPFKLDAGNYCLLETDAPDGFVLNQDEIHFSITNINDTSNKTEMPMIVVKMVNTSKKAKIIVKKEFEKTDFFVGDGVKFALYADNDIFDATNHTLIYEKGELVGTYTLSENNILEIANLPIGYNDAIYRLIEIETYDNYELDLNEHIFDFSNTNESTKEHIQNKTLYNKLICIDTSAMDAFDNDKSMYAAESLQIKDRVDYVGLKAGKKYILEGKLFEKETNKPLLDEEGKEIITTVEFIPEMSNGTLHMYYLLNGEYMKQTTLVVSTKLYNESKELLIEHHNLEDLDQSIEIIPVYDFEIKKLDDKSKELIQDDFAFSVYEDEEWKTLLYNLKSNDKSGSILWEDVTYGTYFLKESVAPNGYQIKTDAIKITVSSSGIYIDEVKQDEKDTYVIEVKNKKIEKIETGTTKAAQVILQNTIMVIISLLVLILLKRKLFYKKTVFR